jgi:hypothetical protein
MIGLSSVPWIQFGPLHIHKVSVPELQVMSRSIEKEKAIFNLQINRMPQMPTLPNSASKSIPRLEDRDFDAVLQ